MSKKKVLSIPAAAETTPAAEPTTPAATAQVRATSQDTVVITLTRKETVVIVTSLLRILLDPPEVFQPQLTFPVNRFQKAMPRPADPVK